MDPARLRDALTIAVAGHPDQAEVAELRDGGAHYFVVPADGDGFELRLGHHDLPALNEPGAVAGPTSRSACWPLTTSRFDGQVAGEPVVGDARV